MIRVRQNKEYILKDADEELMEKGIRGICISLHDILHQFNAHAQPCILHLSTVVFAGP